MHHRLAPLALAVLLFSPTLASALSIGDAMPAAKETLQNADGKDITLAAVAGAKGTAVVFTCNHCPYAKAWEDRIVAIGNNFAKRGVGVIAINSNDPSVAPDDGLEQTKQRAKDKGFAFPYAVDPTSGVAKAFGATKTPEAFVFDAAGKLVYHGAIDDNSADASAVTAPYLTNALDAVVAGKAPEPAETKALGCGIKFR